MYVQNNIALLVPDYGCWVLGDKVEEPYFIIVGFLYGLGLGQVEVSQGDHHSGIHLQGIEKKGTHDFSYHGDDFWWWGCRVVLQVSVICGCTIFGL